MEAAGRPIRKVASGVAIGVAIVAGIAASGVGAADEKVAAVLHDVDGNFVGRATFVQLDDQVLVRAWVRNLPAGFHGFNVHTKGSCSPSFAAAGDHLNPGNDRHPNHAGDLPVLLVKESEKGAMRSRTDRFSLDDLLAGDGTAVVIHADPDNFSNIDERYHSHDQAKNPDGGRGPDSGTVSSGDSGDRIACGEISPIS